MPPRKPLLRGKDAPPQGYPQGAGPLLFARPRAPGPERGQGQAPPFFDASARKVGTIPCGRPPARQFRPAGKKRGHHHPKALIHVVVVRVVPVAVGAADGRFIIVERAAAHHPVVCGPAPATAACYAGRGLPDLCAACPTAPWPASSRVVTSRRVVFCQPPSRRPISVTISATWRYCPPESQPQRTASRR